MGRIAVNEMGRKRGTTERDVEERDGKEIAAGEDRLVRSW